ncbi:MAG: N-acetylmuramoyl-L-alanine amidase [Myxococcota bacterium]
MISISDGIITGAHFHNSPNKSGPLLPDTIVMHYTAGTSMSGAVKWLSNPRAKASAHIVLGRDGEVVQLVSFKEVAWHAGRSRWRGRTGLNNYSIGIEIVNAGPLIRHADGQYRTHFGKIISDPGEVVIATHKHESETRYWHNYTEAQLNKLEELVMALLDEYPPIREIVGHDDIAKGRKSDPGPAFPMERYLTLVEPRQESRPDLMVVTARQLNVREGPGTQYDKLDFGPLKRGTEVRVLEREAPWAFVSMGEGLEGWVSENYLALKR